MKKVAIKDAKNRLTELARLVEQGETVVVTRNGRPVLDMVPHRRHAGLNMAAGKAFLRERGVESVFSFVAEDFDDPLPEDFLLRALPEPMRLLLDTNILVAQMQGTLERRDRRAAAVLAHVDSELYTSVASLWEIAIKARLGKLALQIAPEDLPGYVDSIGLTTLAIGARHAVAAVVPEPATRDPFDRLLLAQCAIEGLQLVTLDQALSAHPLVWREA